ncbi:hypothetical protein D3C78_1086630 [compost metagenome]
MRCRAGQCRGQIAATLDTVQLRRLRVQPADQGFVVVAALQYHHPPEQTVERRRCTEHRFGSDAPACQFGADALLGHLLAGHGETQIQGREQQGERGTVLQDASASDDQSGQCRQQQRQAVQRIDDEDGRPGHGRRRQRPQQLGAIAGEGVQQHMGEQDQADARQQAPAGVAGMGAPAANQPGE